MMMYFSVMPVPSSLILMVHLSFMDASLQEFRQGELTLQTGPVHHQLHDEARRREEILDVKRSLAQEVMLKSKEDAGNFHH